MKPRSTLQRGPARASLFRRFSDTKYKRIQNQFRYKYEKLATKYPWIYKYFTACVNRCSTAAPVKDWNVAMSIVSVCLCVNCQQLKITYVQGVIFIKQLKIN